MYFWLDECILTFAPTTKDGKEQLVLDNFTMIMNGVPYDYLCPIESDWQSSREQQNLNP